MSVSLEERLRGVDVKPGQPVRAYVEGRLLELRVVDTSDEAPVDSAEQPALPEGVVIKKAKPGRIYFSHEFDPSAEVPQ